VDGLTYTRPASLEEVEGTPLAGGTDLVPLLRDGLVGAEALADVRELLPRGIDGGDAGLTIGVGTTLAELERSGAVPKALREAMTYWIALALLVAAVGLIYLLLRSRFGLGLTAIRDSEVAAESQGIAVATTKLWVYVAAALGTGAAGALYFLMNLRISPDAAFGVSWSASIIFIVVIGGIGSLEGPIIGTVLFFALREYLADFGSWHLIVLGTLSIAVILVEKHGLWGLIRRVWPEELFPTSHKAPSRPGAASGALAETPKIEARP